MKTGMNFRGLGKENYIFWSEIGSGFGEPGSTPPPRIPKSTLQVFFKLTSVACEQGSPACSEVSSGGGTELTFFLWI